MVTIEYAVTLKRHGRVTYSDYHYIQHSTLKLCLEDLNELMRVYGDTLVNIRCTIMPYNKNSI